jgi:hypothetical protein
MEINIIRDINEEIICNKIKRGLIARGKNRSILILFMIGLITIFFDNNEFNLAIGMVFIGASLMLYYEKHIPTSSNKKTIGRYKESGQTIKININDSFLIHETMKSYIRIHWSAIDSYKSYKGYLFILPGGNYRSSFVIKKSELAEIEYVGLYDFLKKNYKEKC